MATTEAVDLLREMLATLQRIEVALTARTPLPAVALATAPASVKRPMHSSLKRSPGTVDPLFAALAEIEGSNLGQLSDQGAKTIQRALDEVRQATHDVTPEEIRKRAKRFKESRTMRDWALTAPSLAKHWGKLAVFATGPAQAKPVVPPEPAGWSNRFVVEYPKFQVVPGSPERVSIELEDGNYTVLRWPDLGAARIGSGPPCCLWGDFTDAHSA